MELVVLFLYLLPAMLLHEAGHLVAARLCRVRASELSLGLGPRLGAFSLGGITFSLRAVPLGSFVRLSGTDLSARPLGQQLFVHLGGVVANALFFAATFGTPFGWANLLLAAANLLPLYQHDGWKCGRALIRRVLRAESRPVEWVYTLSGGVASVVIVRWLAQVML